MTGVAGRPVPDGAQAGPLHRWIARGSVKRPHVVAREKTGRCVVVAAPGLTGGVDEAARHLFADRAVTDAWDVQPLTTRGRVKWIAPLFLVAALARLAWWRATGRVDLLHLNTSARGSAVRKATLAALARALRIPYVIQLHGGSFAQFHAGLPRAGKWLDRRFFGGADRVLVLGQPFRELVEGPLAVAPDRVSVMRNAVSVPPVDTRSSGSGMASESAPLILFTGRIGPGKGTPELLDALAAIAHLDWIAVLAGDGDVEGTRTRVGELGLDGRVDVRHWQSRSAVEELLARAEIFVLPSHREALSVALLEAMAAGLCCITTPVGAHGEIVEDGHNGLLVEPGDVAELTGRLSQVLTTPELRATLGGRARRTIETSCSTEVIASQLSAIYQTILQPT